MVRDGKKPGWRPGTAAATRGEAFNQDGMTAAHPSLPLGSRIRVTMQDTGESVVVRVTDRQPRHGVRVIDLSRGAASRIGLLGRGTGWVTLTPVSATEPVEVAEVPEELAPAYADDGPASANPRRRGQPRKHHVRRVASAGRPCCRAPSVAPVRYSAPPRAKRRKL